MNGKARSKEKKTVQYRQRVDLFPVQLQYKTAVGAALQAKPPVRFVPFLLRLYDAQEQRRAFGVL